MEKLFTSFLKFRFLNQKMGIIITPSSQLKGYCGHQIIFKVLYITEESSIQMHLGLAGDQANYISLLIKARCKIIESGEASGTLRHAFCKIQFYEIMWSLTKYLWAQFDFSHKFQISEKYKVGQFISCCVGCPDGITKAYFYVSSIEEE